MALLTLADDLELDELSCGGQATRQRDLCGAKRSDIGVSWG